MKTVEIENQKYELPDWVNYIAMDVDGDWYGYEVEPTINRQYERWLASEGRAMRINDSILHWEGSKRKV